MINQCSWLQPAQESWETAIMKLLCQIPPLPVCAGTAGQEEPGPGESCRCRCLWSTGLQFPPSPKALEGTRVSQARSKRVSSGFGNPPNDLWGSWGRSCFVGEINALLDDHAALCTVHPCLLYDVPHLCPAENMLEGPQKQNSSSTCPAPFEKCYKWMWGKINGGQLSGEQLWSRDFYGWVHGHDDAPTMLSSSFCQSQIFPTLLPPLESNATQSHLRQGQIQKRGQAPGKHKAITSLSLTTQDTHKPCWGMRTRDHRGKRGHQGHSVAPTQKTQWQLAPLGQWGWRDCPSSAIIGTLSTLILITQPLSKHFSPKHLS